MPIWAVMSLKYELPGLEKENLAVIELLCFLGVKKRTFFVYGFAKSSIGNIDDKQLRDFKRTAKAVLALTDDQLEGVLKTGKYIEI